MQPPTCLVKAHLRKLLLTMVRQIEAETRGSDKSPLGDIPCFFGTLTSQRYFWDGIIRVIAQIEGIEDYKSLSKSRRRQLVNKYPLFVAWYCAVRLELSLKQIVIPLHEATGYVGVFEWSPTGGMVHLHYILWVAGAPRFDVRAQKLAEQKAQLRRAGWVCGKALVCKIEDIVDFFSKYISEWNPNKTATGEDLESHVAEVVNAALPHTASLSEHEMLRLLQPENVDELKEYYKRAVRTEHIHDYHYPDPQGAPSPSQPCAQLLKGTKNMWYCKNGYPRDLVCEVCQQNIAQDRWCLMEAFNQKAAGSTQILRLHPTTGAPTNY